MSDHKHDHDHDHHHDHDHGDKSHDHPLLGGREDARSLEQRLAARQAEAEVEPPVGPEPGLEDSGSRALTEALRSSFVIVKILMVLLALVFLGSGFFTVPGNERAIVLRFGRPVGTGADQLLGPGPHWAFPSPIDEVVRIPIGESQQVTSTAGWYATSAEAEAAGGEEAPGPTLNPAADGYTLTSDANIIHVRVLLRYRITNPLNYALNFVNATNVLQNALNNSIFHASSRYTADQAVRLDVTGFKDRILARLQDLIDEQELGIVIDQADVRAIPPRQVSGIFEEVLRAELDRRKAISDAQAYSNRVMATAQGETDAIVNKGREDQVRMVSELAAEADAFRVQLPHYRKNPRLFMVRLQTERLQTILTNVQEKTILPSRADGQRVLRLNIGGDLNRPPPQQPGGTQQNQNQQP